jgi:hypothetical protein
MRTASLRDIARALGGEVSGSQVLAPGPAHGPRDRSLSVRLSATAPDGFLTHSFAGDRFEDCRDHVRSRLDLPLRDRMPRPKRRDPDDAKSAPARARWLWHQRQPIAGSLAERYLVETRGLSGPFPATLSFLPARDGYPPTLIAALGLPTEPEPGLLAISDDAVMAVHLIRLKDNGSGKSDIKPNKITVGRAALGSPIVLAPPNDLLALSIVEGIEDALSIHAAVGVGSWASGGATRMPALAATVPRWIECVTVVAHPDDAGRRHATELAKQLEVRGFETILNLLGGGATP